MYASYCHSYKKRMHKLSAFRKSLLHSFLNLYAICFLFLIQLYQSSDKCKRWIRLRSRPTGNLKLRGSHGFQVFQLMYQLHLNISLLWSHSMALTVLCLRARSCSPAYTAAECTDIDKHSGCLLLLSQSGLGQLHLHGLHLPCYGTGSSFVP